MIAQIFTTTPRRALLTLVLLPLAVGCAVAEKQDPETNVPKVALPGRPPAAQLLEFEEAPDGGPPRPKARIPAPRPRVSQARRSLEPEAELQIRQAAERDSRVREELGARYAHISTSLLKPDKRTKADPSAPRLSRVTFYSYTTNVAVEVRLRDQEVVSVVARKGYQPPESDEEVQVAIGLARQDARLKGKVQDLTGHAILASPEQGWIWNEAGFGHRVLWVTFSKGAEAEPRYWAIVDLSDQKVLNTGAEPKR